jgi:heat-inducible transcriptional repressor
VKMNKMAPEGTLTDRQREILQAIVNTYITTAEAVGSQTVAQKISSRLSPASVRNVMADLEEMGYVRQPHTSAGRVPTENGYRLYVNALMETQELEREKQQWVDELYHSKIKQIEEILELSSRLLSVLSHYTAVVQTPATDEETIKSVNLVPLSSKRVVIILVSNNGNLRKGLAILSRRTTDSEIEKLAAFLDEKICSLSIAAARSLIESFDDSPGSAEGKFAELAREVLQETLAENKEREVYLGGIENIFSQPEFRDLGRLRRVLRVFDEKKRLNDLLGYCMPEGGRNNICIRIGSENMLDDVKGCSLVVSPYRIGGQMRGAIGVIGPTRMQYSRASSVVVFMADRLGHVLTEMCGG